MFAYQVWYLFYYCVLSSSSTDFYFHVFKINFRRYLKQVFYELDNNNNDKKYFKKKERERHLPDSHLYTLLEQKEPDGN